MEPFNFEDLARPQSNDDAALELLPLFALQLDRCVTNLLDAGRSYDYVRAARHCSRLHGTAALYGFRRLADFLQRAESLLLAEDVTPNMVAAELGPVVLKITSMARESELAVVKPITIQ